MKIHDIINTNGTRILNQHPTPWKWVEAGNIIKIRAPHQDLFEDFVQVAEDDCIVDASGFEVIGSSEWIRGNENFGLIIDCVNYVSGIES